VNPRLIASAGPLKGTTIRLVEEETAVGREESNQLKIGDPSLSRRHCCIKRETGRFKLSDLDSLNGTFVNGMPIKDRFLEHGDQIRIGDSLFLFLLEEGEPPLKPALVQVNEAGPITRTTIQLRRDDAVYLQPEKVLAALPATARVARDLNALLKISTIINSVRDLEKLEQQLLELIFEVVPAERGALLLVGENLEEFASVSSRSRPLRTDGPLQVSRSVIQRVLREGIGLLSNDILENEAFRTKSLVDTQVHSLLAVPLVVLGRAIGLIYLISSDPTICFDENHLQLMTAISGLAAQAMENARHVERLESENQRLQAEIYIDHNMVGEGSRMQTVYQFIARVAPTEATVLICGESGTGKELAAHALHLNSSRASRPFVAINCAALTESLLESELFGHEKGAFTGAIAQKKGKLEIADGGTIFLDEVGELAPALQAKLLRVLQERQFERVGGLRPIKVDVRLIAATNKDLREAVRDRTFRQDLYFRLNVVSLTMPPLRERREDIPLLERFFVEKYSKESKRRVKGSSSEARACLMNYAWPGNVRELENAIERAVVLGSTDLILPEDLPEEVIEAEPVMGASTTKYHETIKQAKKQIILKAVEQAEGSITEAARLLGIHPNYLHRLIRNLNLKTELKK